MIDGYQPTILVVDDNEQNLTVVGKMLIESGYKISLVSSGSHALESINNLLPDLILLDIMMPEMDGFEVCKRLKEMTKTKDIPVIFLTARVETEDIVSGFKVGAVDYIIKPFKREELLARVNTHIKLMNAERSLRESLAAKNKLFSIIAHDLRGPMGSFMMMLDLISAHIGSISIDKLQKQINQLQDSSKNTYHLLDNLLTWARSQTGAIKYDQKIHNLRSCVEESIRSLVPAAKSKGISIENNVDDNFLAYFDLNTITTVLRNLVSNSLKFTKEKGMVKIESTKNENSFVLSISDNGIGISDDNIDKLFNESHNFSTIGIKGEKGSGLGLLLCKEFVQKNNGKIWVESKPELGTTFFFTLPLS
jgi:two-component system, sensor histidine kinase and response regulator